MTRPSSLSAEGRSGKPVSEKPILVIAKGGQKLGAIQAGGTEITLTRDHLEVKGTNSVSLLAEQLSKVEPAEEE